MPRSAGRLSPTALSVAMNRRGASVDDLAVLFDVSTGTVRGWLSGRRVPDPPALLALSRALRVRPADLTLVDAHTERISDLRIHAGMLQSEVATASGITQSQLSKIERGVSRPTEPLVGSLASLYGVPPDRVHVAWQRSRDDRKRHAEGKLS